jgi:acetyl esterase/lipase
VLATPPDVGDGLVVHLHGGGYCIGSADGYAGFAGHLGAAAGTRVLVADYRLAPEHPSPAAQDDAAAVWRHAASMVGTTADLAITGDSAGGGLALATALRTRRDGMTPPVAIGLISPWVDLRLGASSLVEHADDEAMLDADLLRHWADRFLAGARRDDPAVSPLLDDLTGLPPLLVQVGGTEILLDDSLGLTAAAARHRVDVTLDVVAEAFHIWVALPTLLPEADDAIARLGRFLAEHLGREHL